jgi:hypothetical protein
MWYSLLLQTRYSTIPIMCGVKGNATNSPEDHIFFFVLFQSPFICKLYIYI